MVLTNTAARTFTNGNYVSTAWTGLADGYDSDGPELDVPKAKELIGWMVKSLVNNVVIDTVTIPKNAGISPGSAGPVAAITFKNNVQSSMTIRFKYWSTRSHHTLDVRGMGNEVPANAKLEAYEWL